MRTNDLAASAVAGIMTKAVDDGSQPGKIGLIEPLIGHTGWLTLSSITEKGRSQAILAWRRRGWNSQGWKP